MDQRQVPRWRSDAFLLKVLCLCVLALVGFAIYWQLGPDEAPVASLSSLPTATPQPVVSVPPAVPPRVGAIKKGDTLGGVLEGLGLEGGAARSAVDAMSPYVDPRKVRVGDLYEAGFDSSSQLASFEMRVPGRGRVRLARLEGGWDTEWIPVVERIDLRVVRGVVEGAFESAVESAGGPAELAYAVADVLQWDLDFSRDLRAGDRFEVVYEELYHDGEFSRIGAVLGLRFNNRGQLYEAHRFGRGDYYDAEGRPLEKMFLRSPLRFSRITSRFSLNRRHPILHVNRPHWGVDYGAPTGTPVMVTAGGTVTFAGWERGGGKVVKVRHPGGYLTNYLHLSGYAGGIRPGRTVRQGEVIGYVGATGLATAPHLDYRVSLNGRWIDPLSLKSVPGAPLSSAELVAFRAYRNALRGSFDSGELPLLDRSAPQVAQTPAPPSVATARRR